MNRHRLVPFLKVIIVSITVFLTLVVFGEVEVKCVLLPVQITTAVADGPKLNANGQHLEFDYCLEQVFEI